MPSFTILGHQIVQIENHSLDDEGLVFKGSQQPL